MKKLVLLFAVAILSFSCSSDEDKTPTINPAQKIAGKWKLLSQKANGSSQELSECEKQSTIYFVYPGQTFLSSDSYTGSDGFCDNSNSNGTYVVDPNSNSGYIVTTNNYVTKFKNVEITASTLLTNEMDGDITLTRTWLKIQ